MFKNKQIELYNDSCFHYLKNFQATQLFDFNLPPLTKLVKKLIKDMMLNDLCIWKVLYLEMRIRKIVKGIIGMIRSFLI